MVSELCANALEYRARELAYLSCVNLIANTISRCTMRTYISEREVEGEEYYLWNYSPSVNQNSTTFWQKLVTRLYLDGEALVIPTRRRDGKEALVVADSFMPPEYYPSKQCEYQGVVVGAVEYDKTFRESEVLHFAANGVNIRPVLSEMCESFYSLLSAAIKQNAWGKGQHWKVHTDQIAGGTPDFEQKFQQMITEQVKPFFDSNGAVLPEFDGYEYTQISGGVGATSDTRDIRALLDDIYAMTARALCIPTAFAMGDVADASDATQRYMTYCIDPLCDQISKEVTRKRYGYDQWRRGSYARLDSSGVAHFDLFGNAASLEKLIGTGAFTINEVRRVAGQVPIDEPWADRAYMTKNIGGIGDESGNATSEATISETAVGTETGESETGEGGE